MDKNINEEWATHLINEVHVNMHLLRYLLEHIQDHDHSDFISRMKVQKELFIKELCRIYDVDVDKHTATHKSVIDRSVDQLQKTIDQSKSKEIFYVLIDRADHLKNAYVDVLFKKSTTELARMILRNHLNEIKRDQHILRDLQENLKRSGVGLKGDS